MFAVESIIDRLEEQIKLAPQLVENGHPGGRFLDDGTGVDEGTIFAWLANGIGRCNHIPQLAAVEAGPRRYRKCLEKARDTLLPLVAEFKRIAAVQGAPYTDGNQREKAMKQLSDVPGKIVSACKAAISDLEAGMAILEEGERKEAKLAGASK